MLALMVVAVFLSPIFASSSNPSESPPPTLTTLSPPQTTSAPIDPVCITPSEPCNQLPAVCLRCYFDMTCRYGHNVSVQCSVLPEAVCSGSTGNFTRYFICRFCYQTPVSQYKCKLKSHCHMPGVPRSFYETSCTASKDQLCIGRRSFQRMLPCNWTRGKSWVTALLLSIFLGGFGADRFYLDMWREGLGKLFSFGGLGVWTIVDVILIAVGYVRPQDGSLYVEFMP